MAESFLGFTGSYLELSHRPQLAPFLRSHAVPLSGYTFAMLAAWNGTFKYRWFLANPELLLSSYILEPDPNRHLMQPIGELAEPVQEQILREGRKLPYTLRISGVTEGFIGRYPGFVQHFDVVEERDQANYVYAVEDLARLAGKRYSAKRNHISQAERLYTWQVERVTASNVDACRQVLHELDAEETAPLDRNRRWERAALDYVLDHFGELEQQGVLIAVEGKPVAFSLCERLTDDTAVIHFERALRNRKGLYQIVNREAARVIESEGYRFINREEDIGDEGLRKAKLSYYPVTLTKAFTLTLKR